MAKAAKKLTGADIDLNRWCIEMAMHWPVITSTASFSGGAIGGGYPPQTMPQPRDCDVIARANKIIAWVKAQH